MQNFNIRDPNNTTHTDIDDYYSRLKKTKIFNKSYEQIIKQFDDSNAIMYLDPPYEGSEDIYKHFDIDYKYLANLLKNAKSKILLSINYNKEFIKLFNFMKYKILTTKYADPSSGGQTRVVKELLFYNF